ncbi:hypothetical protein V8G54_018160, partial [Vigna mungo]
DLLQQLTKKTTNPLKSFSVTNETHKSLNLFVQKPVRSLSTENTHLFEIEKRIRDNLRDTNYKQIKQTTTQLCDMVSDSGAASVSEKWHRECERTGAPEAVSKQWHHEQ